MTVSSTYLVSLVLESFFFICRNLESFSRQEVKSLSEIPPTILHHKLTFTTQFSGAANVTVSFVKICLGHLPCGSSIASFAGLPTKHPVFH